jgi:hypothetical protein
MTWIVVVALGLTMLILGITEQPLNVRAASGYPQIDPLRFVIGAGIASIPVVILENMDEKLAWVYVFLIALVFLISKGNYIGVQKFMRVIR